MYITYKYKQLEYIYIYMLVIYSAWIACGHMLMLSFTVHLFPSFPLSLLGSLIHSISLSLALSPSTSQYVYVFL